MVRGSNAGILGCPRISRVVTEMSPLVDISGPRFGHFAPPGILLDISRAVRGQHAQDFFHVGILVRLLPEEDIHQMIGAGQPAAFPVLERKSTGESEHPGVLPRAVESFLVRIEPLNDIGMFLFRQSGRFTALGTAYMDDDPAGRTRPREQFLQSWFADASAVFRFSVPRCGREAGQQQHEQSRSKPTDVAHRSKTFA